jgi:hypothetical protein
MISKEKNIPLRPDFGLIGLRAAYIMTMIVLEAVK